MSDEELRRLADEQRAADAARGRARERWLRQQDREEATLRGALASLVEGAVVVRLQTTAGRAHNGVLAGLGRDFCRLRVTEDRDMFITIAALGVVEPAPGTDAPPVSGTAGASAAGEDLTLAEVLGRLAPDSPWVSLRCAGTAEPVTGSLCAAGVDVLTVRLDREAGTNCYVALSALTEATVRFG
ncbi:hypothetical protein ER308_10995 [Egibacter rhizosphaerae]|uniref:Uncharacterized protein n=1 Tax=Egibacter rhizosphaerae TaxID=1670831 RepID=A0A411YFK7_9ACTN|nr:hypothetical protein [Egibacter rhizosphaerae]QBI20033.1 hypothetical protein ER308_10995 [Egibacter rhizosphaerae]